MKYEVKATITIHCNLPDDALRIVRQRLRIPRDKDKVKMRKAVVKPISKPSWHMEE